MHWWATSSTCWEFNICKTAQWWVSILSMVLGNKLKSFEFVEWLNCYFLDWDCFLSCLWFLFIILFLEFGEGLGSWGFSTNKRQAEDTGVAFSVSECDLICMKVLNTLLCIFLPSRYLPEWSVYSIFCPFKKLSVLFSRHWVLRVLSMFRVKVLY